MNIIFMYQDIDGVALMIQDVCGVRGKEQVNDRIVQPRGGERKNTLILRSKTTSWKQWG